MTSPYTIMQRTVEAVQSSPHPTNKIASSIQGQDASGKSYMITATNHWPRSIEKHLGTTQKIGNSSGTIHAEVACILQAPRTENAKLYITDPPCPNCAKNMAEAGIKTLYIDHKGFKKDFAMRRGNEFSTMSMRILEHAGICVHKIWRKEQRYETILDIPNNYVPASEFPLHIEKTDLDFHNIILQASADYPDTPFALCLAKNHANETVFFQARRHPTIGYTHNDDLKKEGKYSYLLQPINRLIMGLQKDGYKLINNTLYSSQIPTSRELVNLIGAHITTLYLPKNPSARDDHSRAALKQLQHAGIFKILNI